MNTAQPTSPGRRSRRSAAVLRATVLSGVMTLALTGCGGRAPEEPTDPVVQNMQAAQEHIDIANAAYNANRPDEAILHYEEALKSYNNFPAAWNNLGVLYMQRGKNMDAATCFRTAADLNRVDPVPVANLGALWQKQQYWDDAAKHYDQALERDPNYIPALVNSVVVDHYRDHRTEATADRIRRALLLVNDPALREYLTRQKQLVEGRLSDRPSSLGR